MDTRTKIVRLDELPARLSTENWLAVAGLFDPLTATQAGRMADFAAGGRAVLALVLDVPDTLLPAEARAALMAALRPVRLVAIANLVEWQQVWRSQLSNLGTVEIAEDLAAEQARAAGFVEFVLRRGSVQS